MDERLFPTHPSDGARIDPLTGLMTRGAFLSALDGQGKNGGRGGVVYFDVQRFKTVNSKFGTPEGDRLLVHIARCVRKAAGPDAPACRLSGDRFALFVPGDRENVERRVEELFDGVAGYYGLTFEILCNAGIYYAEGPSVPAGEAVDRAIMAQRKIKGSFTRRLNYYSESLRSDLLSEQEIAGAMRGALNSGQFVVYYQPQYNHSTGMLVGAEALVRWRHPEKGLIPPGRFIPLFESNGFVTWLDQYVFEEVCGFQRRRMDQGAGLVPVSVNLTRYDIFSPGFLEKLEAIRAQSGVPSQYIRIEITESSAQGNSRFINEALRTLHQYGYTTEMDDFGSGYSSLNILKDIDFDVIKLDTRFFQDDEGREGRGGVILSSVVRMVNWLQLPVIAEGVETEEQAGFLQSIGCDLIQGFLYSKPLPEPEFAALLQEGRVGRAASSLRLIETMDAGRFWSSDTLETLIFSNYVGGAAIFDYSARSGSAEILRVNRKYLQELGMNLSERELVNKDLLSFLEGASLKIYREMLDRAAKTGEEQECETWRTLASPCCGEERVCIRTTARVVGRGRERCLFYAMIRNITAEKRRFNDLLEGERRFMAASEQVNIYYWEYTVATHEMRPCFRCMRDLGLPALLTNYPDSAIEMGVFPPEVAEEYREWHRKIDAGEAKTLEAVMPLTVGRVPFHVRYTVEFDENGRPVKAYGSAALVVDGEGEGERP